MPWEVVMGAAGGLALGLGLAGIAGRGARKREARAALERDVALRRLVLPVLERRADALGVPPSERGSNDQSPAELVIVLGRAIGHLEESADLPFGDTVEVARDELERE